MLLRHSRRIRPRTVTIVLGLTLVVIPYIVDVAFLWDLTPVHFAQENIVESEDLQDIDEKGPVLNISDSLLYRSIQSFVSSFRCSGKSRSLSTLSYSHSDFGNPRLPSSAYLSTVLNHQFRTRASRI